MTKNTGQPACPFNPKAWAAALKWVRQQYRNPACCTTGWKTFDDVTCPGLEPTEEVKEKKR